MVRSIYILWDMVFVICIELYVDTLLNMDLVYVWYVRHGVWRYMKSMYDYFVRNVFVKYMEVWDRWYEG